MAEAIAIISILSGAAVAIVVPFISATLERSRLQQQTRSARMEELRLILDEATQHLMSARLLLLDGQGLRLDLRPGEEPPERLREYGDALTKQADALVQDGMRIVLRTPEGAAITRAHDRAQFPFHGFEAAYRSFLQTPGQEGESISADLVTYQHHLSGEITNFTKEVRALVGVVTPQPQ